MFASRAVLKSRAKVRLLSIYFDIALCTRSIMYLMSFRSTRIGIESDLIDIF